MCTTLINVNILVDKDMLKEQIKAVLESNIKEEYKSGIHGLLGAVLDGEEV